MSEEPDGPTGVRRLLLPAAEVAVRLASDPSTADLPVELRTPDLPAPPAAPPRPDGPADGPEHDGPGGAVRDVEGGTVLAHPAVVAALALLAAPGALRLVVRAAVPSAERVTALAVAGRGGTSLARDVRGGRPEVVEQAVFPVDRLAAQLLACLPPLPSAPAAAREPARLGALSGSLLLEALGVRVLLVHAHGGWWRAGAALAEPVDPEPVVLALLAGALLRAGQR